MKKFYFLFFTLLFFRFSYSQIRFENIINNTGDKTQNTFTDIPLRPHENKVDIFSPNEKPKQDFYKVRIIEASNSSTYNDLLAQLKTRAQLEGFDGLLLLGQNSYTYKDNSVGSAVITGLVEGSLSAINKTKDNNYHSSDNWVTGETLSAIGLKYKANMYYVNSIIKKAIIELNDSSKTKYIVSFATNGKFLEPGINKDKDFYLKNIALYDHANSFAKNKITQFTSIKSDDRLTVTAKLATDSGYIKYLAGYNNLNTLSVVDIKLPSSPAYSYERRFSLTYEMNDNNILKRNINAGRKNNWIYYDEYNYNSNNKVAGFIRYKADSKEKIFTVNYEYYTLNDLPEAEK